MQDVAILNRDWLLIGRQVRTAIGKLIDLLAIDYASWMVTLADYQLEDIYQEFAERYDRPQATLGKAFANKFGIDLDAVTLNENHKLVVVATQLSASSERINNYLTQHAQLSINAMYFSAFEDVGSR
ncbi:hypothetical protein [Halomonas rhizosphaerae]|uniref:Uncharacterized protein n=1 Tax=Halomonas rhizosphaerae TaxID=3043296 RepID=A0ABT6UZH9_9GAMM|nr:hypothetical protein [Halomonas rhizosphaerae]MDI5891086.1 hypothetical protein [Halomonas rhizosphaerae]